jgi:hypothetical protein
MNANPITTIPAPAYKPTPAETKTLKAAKTKVEHLNGLLAISGDLKAHAVTLQEQLVQGEASILDVAPMLWLCGDPDRRNQLAPALRKPIREALTAECSALTPIFENARTHQADHAAKLCSETEKTERKQAAKAGLNDDEYQPSELLMRLRETHKRLKEQPVQPSLSGITSLLEG